MRDVAPGQAHATLATEVVVLLALLACVEPTKPAWSTQADPTVLRDTSVDSGSDTGAQDSGTDSAGEDTGVADTSDTATDTGVADTSDTGAADTATDTGATDTSDTATDTGVADTSDTGAADTSTDTGATDTGTSVAVDAPADWVLEDINPGSYRFGEPISPRDYISRVSGYYFIHST